MRVSCRRVNTQIFLKDVDVCACVRACVRACACSSARAIETGREGERGERGRGMRRGFVISGDGGFFLACEDLGRMFDNSFPACTFFFFFFNGD